MTKFRFLHSADLHLDSPLQRDVGPLLSDASNPSFGALTNLVSLAIAKEVDFILIAGDLYDDQDRSLQAQLHLQRELYRLQQAGIMAYIVHGNHDPCDGWQASLQWPAGVHFFGSGQVEAKGYFRDGRELARIYGISYPRSRVTESYLPLFQREADAPYTIGLLHANVGGVGGYKNYAPCTLGELCETRFDYWALGHVHIPQVLHPREPVVIYPGNIQGRGFRETGERGCYVVEVEDGLTTYQFYPLQMVAWQTVAVDIGAIETDEQLVTLLRGQITGLCQEQQSPLMVRFDLVGKGPLHYTLTRPDYLEELCSYLRGEEIAARVWVDSIVQATGAPNDVVALGREESLVGDFVRLVERARLGEEGPAGWEEALEELYGHPDIRRYLDIPQLADEDGLLNRVLEYGLDLLLPGEDN